MSKDGIVVSVICLTYNHEKYLKDTLNSILNQCTNFNFEVIVHDDASEDGNQKIIREYAEAYPEKVIPIIQEVNQYRQGKNIIKHFVLPKVRGKYIAFCEGDDFWIDNNKLQKQVDYMDSHEECTLCIHNSIDVDLHGEKIAEKIISSISKEYSVDEVIAGGGAFCYFNSIMFPTRVSGKLIKYLDIISLDLVWQMLLASFGQTYLIADKMSAYRKDVPGSWTKRMRTDLEAKKGVLLKIIEVYDLFDKDSDRKYHRAITIQKFKAQIEIVRINKKQENKMYKRLFFTLIRLCMQIRLSFMKLI